MLEGRALPNRALASDEDAFTDGNLREGTYLVVYKFGFAHNATVGHACVDSDPKSQTHLTQGEKASVVAYTLL